MQENRTEYQSTGTQPGSDKLISQSSLQANTALGSTEISSAGRKRILVADDDASVRSSLKRVLEDCGFTVAVAHDGRETIERLGSDTPDLMVLDITMPHQNGWEVFEHVTVSYPDLPVVIITGMAHQRQTEIARAAGAFLEKPLDVSVLLETLQASLAEPAEARLQRRRAYLDGILAISGAGTRGDAPFINSWSQMEASDPAQFPDAVSHPKSQL